MVESDRSRGGRPVRRSDSKRLGPRFVRRQEPTGDRIDANERRRKRPLHRIDHESHALALRAKHLREFRGHRHRVCDFCIGADLERQLSKYRAERIGRMLQLVGPLARHNDRIVRHERDLCVHAADIPADYSHII